MCLRLYSYDIEEILLNFNLLIVILMKGKGLYYWKKSLCYDSCKFFFSVLLGILVFKLDKI